MSNKEVLIALIFINIAVGVGVILNLGIAKAAPSFMVALLLYMLVIAQNDRP